jgi:hypothetical protein
MLIFLGAMDKLFCLYMSLYMYTYEKLMKYKKKGKITLSILGLKKILFLVFMMWLLHRKKKNAPPIATHINIGAHLF